MTQIYSGITVYYNDIPYSIFLLSGLPVQRIVSELKKITNPVEEKSGANGSSSSRKSNATSLKMLLEKEMAKEVESKRRPPSVIGRLMGLEDLPTEESIVHHTKVDLTRDLNASNKTLHGKEHHQSIRLKTQDHQSIDETIGYNDVYEVSEQQSGTSYFQDQTSLKGWPSENKRLPVQRIISELKKITNPVEEKSVSFVHIFLFESFNMMNCRDLSSL